MDVVTGAADRQFSVGLTGGIGSGKTTVANLFATHGATVIDTDLIAHQLTSTGGAALPHIEATFGAVYLMPDGSMNRSLMRDHVFSNAAAKKQLEAILHPLIRVAVEDAAQNTSGAYLMYVVPLLVESTSWRNRVTRILVVDCPEQLQVARVMQRSALLEQQIRAIMATQATRADRLMVADDVIINDADAAALTAPVARLHQTYCQLAANSLPTSQ